jgi:hypothetical protein
LLSFDDLTLCLRLLRGLSNFLCKATKVFT